MSDPKLWEAFYKNMAEGKFNPYKYRPKQKGRGWNIKSSFRIPVQPNAFPNSDMSGTIEKNTEKPSAELYSRKRSIRDDKTKENMELLCHINELLHPKTKRRKPGLID